MPSDQVAHMMMVGGLASMQVQLCPKEWTRGTEVSPKHTSQLQCPCVRALYPRVHLCYPGTVTSIDTPPGVWCVFCIYVALNKHCMEASGQSCITPVCCCKFACKTLTQMLVAMTCLLYRCGMRNRPPEREVLALGHQDWLEQHNGQHASSYRVSHQCTAPLLRANCIPHCSVLL